MHLRACSPKDADEIGRLAARISAFGVPNWRSERQMVERDVRLCTAAAEASDPNLVVAELDGCIGGFVWFSVLTDIYTGREHGHISDLAVRPDLEGHGIGTKLLEHAEQWARARGFDWITLTVFPQNAGALGLYQRRGYAEDMARLLKPLAS